MADLQAVYSSSSLIRTGRGQLDGCVISTTSATGVTATFYDNTSGSGTKIFEANVIVGHPLIMFFSETFSPGFATGLYLALAANMTATVWIRQL